ncbi:4-alpha-glucanotransferase [Pseudomonas sp. JS3066]|uniref:4-alpha-glucanotransferase n=1 Tax=unclassified Pseudomonas TaxID=196821 RepID=UPI000EA9CCD8|nr:MULTISPECIES: 4-alpha-glucanotransferase [unclassified Pseudomonas]AYF86751.1 4-alpha-glucanotransferase [Pseudomonas sp. DY-1]WVK95778.1 4-alpha-glucanotransferase [Pseudomonas sp. JS3066]
MSDVQLAALASAVGLQLDWMDADGQPQRVSPEVQRALLEAMGYAAQSPQQIAGGLVEAREHEQATRLGPLIVLDQGDLLSLAGSHRPGHAYQLHLDDGRLYEGRLDADCRLLAPDACGYHQLRVGDSELCLAVAPPACPSVRELLGHAQAWGLAAQFYALRRPGDGGLGDTSAVEDLARSAARHGADALAISPVHAMFSANGAQYSPYSPSSRLHFNVLHAAPAHVLGDAELQRALAATRLGAEYARLEALPLLDWPALSTARMAVLRQLYRQFDEEQGVLRQDFERFCETSGDALLLHCRFEALHGHMLANGAPGDWRCWPEHLRNPAHAAVQRFALEHAREVEFHAFAQWLVVRGLERAQMAAVGAGMGIGLIADLAVGADCSGSQAWACQDQLLATIRVGAPPDILNRSGQNWGVWAFSPLGLKENGYQAFIQMLRASLGCSGGVRIDHVMGLQRLWVIPEGARPEQGAYLRFPFHDLLRLISLEAWRSQGLVIGEDLGTVPDGLREELARRNVLGMRVLLFEQRDGEFIPPCDWPQDALATTSTHDLPTLNGWFQGKDIDWRLKAGHCDAETARHSREIRERECRALTAALRLEGHLSPHEDSRERCVQGCIGYVAETPAPLVLLPLEDLLGESEQANLPGPGDAHPNWRRRWPTTAAELIELPTSRRHLACLTEGRDMRREVPDE